MPSPPAPQAEPTKEAPEGESQLPESDARPANRAPLLSAPVEEEGVEETEQGGPIRFLGLPKKPPVKALSVGAGTPEPKSWEPARRKVLGVQNQLSAAADIRNVELGMFVDLTHERIADAASSAIAHVRNAKVSAHDQVAHAVLTAKIVILETALGTLERSSKRIFDTEMGAYTDAGTAIKLAGTISKKHQTGAKLVRVQAQLTALNHGTTEGKRGADGIQGHADAATEAGRVKASTYGSNGRGKAQAEAVREVAGDFARELVKPKEAVESAAVKGGLDLAKGMDNAELELLPVFADAALEVSSGILKQAKTLRPKFADLSTRNSKSILDTVERVLAQLDALEGQAKDEITALSMTLVGGIRRARNKAFGMLDTQREAFFTEVTKGVVEFNMFTRSLRKPDVAAVKEYGAQTQLAISDAQDRFKEAVTLIGDVTSDGIDDAGNMGARGLRRMGSGAAAGIARVSEMTKSSFKIAELTVQIALLKFTIAWKKAMLDATSLLDGALQDIVDKFKALLKDEVGKATKKITETVDEALKKNKEPLAQIEAKMEEAAAAAREEYDKTWYEKVWDVLGTILVAVLTLLAIVVVAVVGIVLIIGGIIYGSVAAIVVGVVMLLGAVGYMLYGIVSGIVHRVSSADSFLGGVWGLVVGILDLTGIPNVIEGIWGHDLVNGRKLTGTEARQRLGMGIFGVLMLLLPIKGLKGGKGKAVPTPKAAPPVKLGGPKPKGKSGPSKLGETPGGPPKAPKAQEPKPKVEPKPKEPKPKADEPKPKVEPKPKEPKPKADEPRAKEKPKPNEEPKGKEPKPKEKPKEEPKGEEPKPKEKPKEEPKGKEPKPKEKPKPGEPGVKAKEPAPKDGTPVPRTESTPRVEPPPKATIPEPAAPRPSLLDRMRDSWRDRQNRKWLEKTERIMREQAEKKRLDDAKRAFDDAKSKGPAPRAAGPTQLLGADAKTAAAVQKIKPLEGIRDVAIHGTKTGFEVLMPNGKWVHMNQRGLATWLSKQGHKRGQPIRLLSCETGGKATGIAQHLSNKLGSPVMAPSKTLWVKGDGSLVIGKTPKRATGKWEVFSPKKSTTAPWYKRLFGDKKSSSPDGSGARSLGKTGELTPAELTHIVEPEISGGGTFKGGGHAHASVAELTKAGFTEITPAQAAARRAAEAPFRMAMEAWQTAKSAKARYRKARAKEEGRLNLKKIQGQLKSTKTSPAEKAALALQETAALKAMTVWEAANPRPTAVPRKPSPTDFGLPDTYNPNMKYFYREKLGQGPAEVGGIHPTSNKIHWDGHTWFPSGWGAARIKMIQTRLQAAGADVVVTNSGTMTKYTAWVKFADDGSLQVAPKGTPDPGAAGYVKTSLLVPADEAAGRSAFPEMNQ